MFRGKIGDIEMKENLTFKLLWGAVILIILIFFTLLLTLNSTKITKIDVTDEFVAQVIGKYVVTLQTVGDIQHDKIIYVIELRKTDSDRVDVYYNTDYGIKNNSAEIYANLFKDTTYKFTTVKYTIDSFDNRFGYLEWRKYPNILTADEVK